MYAKNSGDVEKKQRARNKNSGNNVRTAMLSTDLLQNLTASSICDAYVYTPVQVGSYTYVQVCDDYVYKPYRNIN